MLLIKYPRFDLAMVLGYFLGAGMLTKTPAFVNILLLPTTLISFNFRDVHRQNKLLRLLGLWIIAIVIGMLIYNILRLGAGFDNLNSRNQDYLFSPTKLLGHPLDPWFSRIPVIFDYGLRFLGVPILLLVLLSFGLTLKTKNRYSAILMLWSLIPLVVELCLLKSFTARYILFSIPPLLIGAGWSIDTG